MGGLADTQEVIGHQRGTTNETTMNTAFGQGNWQLGHFETINVAQVFGPGTCTIFIDGTSLDALDALDAHPLSTVSAVPTVPTPANDDGGQP